MQRQQQRPQFLVKTQIAGCGIEIQTAQSFPHVVRHTPGQSGNLQPLIQQGRHTVPGRHLDQSCPSFVGQNRQSGRIEPAFILVQAGQ